MIALRSVGVISFNSTNIRHLSSGLRNACSKVPSEEVIRVEYRIEFLIGNKIIRLTKMTRETISALPQKFLINLIASFLTINKSKE